MSVLAIYVIALTTILSAFATPPAASAAFDPFSVICHSGPQGASPSESGPAAPASLPQKACDHCTLCGSVPALAVPAVLSRIDLAPSGLAELLYPPTAAPARGIALTPKLARGPPRRT